jgi:O-antigen ligase
MSPWAEKSKSLGGHDGVTLIVGLGLAFFFLTRVSLGVSVFTLALMGMFHALKNRKVHSQFLWRDGQWFIIAASLPLAYFFRMLVSDFDHRMLDKVARFILIIPIYWIVRSFGISASKVLIFISAGVFTAGFESFFQVSNGIQRVSGTSIPNSIPFGNFALLFGVLSVLLIIQKNRDETFAWAKWVGMGGFLAGMFTSIASGSRGGWVAIPLFILVYWSFFGSGNKFVSYMVAIAIVVVMPLLVYFVPAISDRLALGVSEAHSFLSRTGLWMSGETTSSIGIRLDMWAAGIDAFRSAPVFGLGFTGFNEFLHDRVEMGLTHPDLEVIGFKHLHCEIITTAAKLGLMGLFALAVLWVGGIWWFLRNTVNKDSNGKIFRVMGLITFTAMIVYSMTDSMFGMTLQSMVYTMLLGISAGGLRHAELNPEPGTAGQ